MPSVYALKPAFQNWLRPAVKWLAERGVTPNQVTIAGGVASVLVGCDLIAGSRTWLLLPLFLPMRMALNAMDGMLAEERRMRTRTGAILNEGLDLVSDAALTLPFVAVPGLSAGTVWLCIVAAVLVEVAGFARAGARRYEGPFGKSDRAVVLGAAGGWLGLGWPVTGWAGWLPWVWMLLCVVTIANRLRPVRGS